MPEGRIIRGFKFRVPPSNPDSCKSRVLRPHAAVFHVIQLDEAAVQVLTAAPRHGCQMPSRHIMTHCNCRAVRQHRNPLSGSDVSWPLRSACS